MEEPPPSKRLRAGSTPAEAAGGGVSVPGGRIETEVKEPSMNLVELAEEIATRAHEGQVDKAGQPYIDHPRRVAARVPE